jgi:hypothetical protein
MIADLLHGACVGHCYQGILAIHNVIADDQVIISNTEDNLQKAAHKLNQIITERGLNISVHKTKWMAFKGQEPVRSKIVIANKIIKQVHSVNYLENFISYEKMDIDNKLSNYLKITCIINNVFRLQKTLNKTRTKLYSALALPTLIYGSETWTIKARDARRITTAEMKYMGRTAGYTWTDHKTNAEIAKKLNVTPVLGKIQSYRRNWIKPVNRMSRNGLLRILKNCTPKGRRNQGRPMKRLLDK